MGNTDTADVPLLAYDLKQTAQATGLCVRTLRKLIDNGQLAASRVGDRWLVRRDAIEKLLQRRYVPTTGDEKRKRDRAR